MINVEVIKNTTENTTSLIRRFTKRVQGSGILPRVRSLRYFERPASEFKKKKQILRKIERREEFETLYKQGKVEERKGRGRRR
ncbi:30S ribosomal protein S21 [Candidatus Kaiserbacteria bacterium]|nr:30S ribosomal protein S21 [Candidatus Kaiserbacteria bacterium]